MTRTLNVMVGQDQFGQDRGLPEGKREDVFIR